MQLRAPAKINLSFRILGRRTDGFHEIETLMAPVSLCDKLKLSTTTKLAGEIELVCDDPSLPAAEDNLAVRAARLFLQATSIRTSLRIELQKRIPHGAGLGGGSSDAASVLLGLNELLQAGLNPGDLAKLAAQIGSDVPFFIYRSAAICRGRGELVTPTNLSQPFPLLLLKPEFGVPTPWAYRRWTDSKELPGISYQAQEFGGSNFINALERPVFEKYVFLARMKTWLLAQPEVEIALLSGSGSTGFAVLQESADREAVAVKARAELDPGLWTCVCDAGRGS